MRKAKPKFEPIITKSEFVLTRWTDAPPPKPVVCLPLMTKPATNPFDGRKYLPEMWKPE